MFQWLQQPFMLLKGLIVFSTLVASGCSLRSGSEPPVIGDWTLDLGRTVYGPSVEKRVDERFTCSMDGKGVHCRISSTKENGTVNSGSFDAVPDGPPGEVQGIEGLDNVRLTSAEAGVMEATFYDRDRPRFAYRAWREDAGRTLVIVTVDPITRNKLSTTVVYQASHSAA